MTRVAKEPYGATHRGSALMMNAPFTHTTARTREHGHTHTRHMKLTTSWNLGNFNVTLAKDVTGYERDTLAEYGLRWLGQRNTQVDLTLGIASVKPGKKAGKTKIVRDGRTRTDIPFTPAMADKLANDFHTLGDDEFKLDSIVVTVGEKQTETKEKKYQRAINKLTQRESMPDFETWLADKVGFEGETHDENGEYTQEVILAVDKFIADALANM